MNSIELNAPAKINLSIDVLGKRADGYHEVKMIMQTISLHDIIYIEKAKKGINVACQSPEAPSGRWNIAYKTAGLMIDRYNIKSGVKITIDKRIPVASGLAGGSTDAAAVIKGMNVLFGLGLDEQELMITGKQVGADVPFCIKGGTALAEGIGDVLTGLGKFSGINIVVVKPKIGVKTAWVYKSLNLDMIDKRPDTDLLVDAVNSKNADMVAKNMVNVLETVTIQRYGVIKEIKECLIELGASGSLMSGSGPSVFGLFMDRQPAESTYNLIKGSEWDCFLVQTL
jgi:4-diphosphocytidyl-2-C-methyl-D-erythritol kinase